MWHWIKNLFTRKPSKSARIAEQDQQILSAAQENLRLRQKLVEQVAKNSILEKQHRAEMQKLDRRAQFELKAAMETKIRVWYREMKDLPPNELRARFNAVKQEVDNIDAQIKRNRSVEMPNYENVMDFTPHAAHAGLSRTGTK